jgi:uncharacterized membrane protein affecting hemolysin expression
MFTDPIFLIAAALCLVVLIILMTGIGVFTKGGETNRKWGNKLMRLRIIAQAVAVLVILGAVWLKSRG